MLNPNAEVSKEFYPRGVEGLLVGDFGEKLESYEYVEDIPVLLSQPLPYPIGMVNQLSALLKNKVSVSAAYLAQMHDVKRDPEPTLVIGLEISSALTDQERQEMNKYVGQAAFNSLTKKNCCRFNVYRSKC